ncbi:transcription elongation factor Elf1 like-domain-containing protein [Phakopsora pachyrhizi]|uniref:Transcription elongation factor 1 homolog n=1 Tax=Phakopsora pachyrhizi TaxID=170000 RepID=A0AAV0BDT3_PHAPC|nr:transcription elongation factor Elf1 like-domain-containing protein [Phakopsora pachyrhizi]CAH7683866.1 transcription elongation factor Elf1 like-domain-containing protein [Phakopsora pachyrhizi]
MGKRKAARKPGKKTKLKPLDKVFRCLFCQHAGVVHCKLDRQEMVSRIECSRCAQFFETKIDHLTEPIDVYSMWIDASELANRPEPNRDGRRKADSRSQLTPARNSNDKTNGLDNDELNRQSEHLNDNYDLPEGL